MALPRHADGDVCCSHFHAMLGDCVSHSQSHQHYAAKYEAAPENRGRLYCQ